MSYETDGIYIGNNYHNQALTHVFFERGGAWSTNLLTLMPPYALFNNPVAVNDYLYIGTDRNVVPATAGLFSNVIFDVVSPFTGTIGNWQYWTGAAWANIPTVVSRLNNFGSVGQYSLAFIQPSNWTFTALAIGTIFPIRVIVTNAGTGVPPILANHPYTVQWAYIETDLLQGDEEANFLVDTTRQYETVASRVLIARRKVSRGEDFSAYLNFADRQQPSGVVCTIISASAFFQFSQLSHATSRVAFVPAAGLTDHEIARIEINPPYSEQYVGRFRAYLRCNINPGNPGKVDLKVVISSGDVNNIFFNSPYINLDVTREVLNLEFGTFTIPPIPDSEKMGTIYIRVLANTYVGVADCVLYDFIMLPDDEMLIEARRQYNNIAITDINDDRLLMDNVTSPKNETYSILLDTSDYKREDYQTISRSGLFGKPGDRVRYWFLFCDKWYNGSDLFALAKMKFNHTSRYYSMRGDR